MARDDDETIPGGRFGRFKRLAVMATQVGSDLAKSKLQKWAGAKGIPVEELTARRVLETLGSLKGIALKAGQTMSLFANQLPPEARAIVAKMYSSAPALPFEKISQVIRQELGAAPEEIFASFDPKPFAAASLGQVHAAALKSGEAVAVKVQYPGIAEALESDLKNIEALTGAVGMVFDSRAYASEIRREVTAELDYQREREQLESFRSLLAPWPELVVPQSHASLSTRRVLVMERLTGPTLGEAVHSLELLSEEARWQRATQLTCALFGPLFSAGVLHADTHPGNFLLLADGRLGVLDFGSVKRLSPSLSWCLGQAVAALIEETSVDWLSLLREGGFEFSLAEDRANFLLSEILDVLRKPIRGVYDFGTDDTLDRLAALKFKYPLELLKLKPPAESLLVARGIAGGLQNLRALRASGDLRPVLKRLLSYRSVGGSPSEGGGTGSNVPPFR